jgi:hypothetical protein
MGRTVLVAMAAAAVLHVFPRDLAAQYARYAGDRTYELSLRGVTPVSRGVELPGAAHGTAVEVSERYWTWCDAWIDYPCRKTRIVTRWQYKDLRVKLTAYAFYCTYDACQGDGNRHKWNGGCLGAGSRTCYWSGLRKTKLSNEGSCNYINDPVTEQC